MEQKESAVIYIDVESLFDIRQGILYHLIEDKDKLTDFLLSEEYIYRELDSFPSVNMDDYNALLENPPKEVLEASVLTYMFTVLKLKLQTYDRINKFQNTTKIPEIVLNIFPFKFTPEELEHIRNLLFVKLDDKIKIDVIYLDKKRLTPYYLNEGKFAYAYIYDFGTWIEHNIDSLNEIGVPNCNLVFCAVGKQAVDESQKEVITKMGFKDIFSYLEFSLSHKTKVTFAPVLFYCNIVTASFETEQINETLIKNNLAEKAPEGTSVDEMIKESPP